MAERKRALRGGMDAREMAKRSHEARRLRKQAAEDEALLGDDAPVSEDLSSLPRTKLIQVLQDRTTHPRELVQAAKALAAIPVDDESTGWRASAQVREDFVPPSPLEVFRVWVQAGAITRDDLKALFS